MKATLVPLVAALLVAATACGDNSKSCGPGTKDVDGTCVPAAVCGRGTVEDPTTKECVPDGTVVCVDGTTYDIATGRCVIDPAACQDGTTRIGGACVDPTKGTPADIEEGPEPNGLGALGETSVGPAGVITLKPAGSTFILHGRITPFRDLDGDGQPDPDADAYTIAVTAPTLLRVTADGLDGLSAGFLATAQVAANDPLAAWQRKGIQLASDGATREIYLPAAGTYVLAIADQRSLLLANAAAGGPDAEYYVAVEALPVPAPTTVTSSPATGTIDRDVALYAMPAGTTFADLTLAMPQVQATASIVAVEDGTVRGVADESTTPAHLAVAAIGSGHTLVVVVDNVVDYAPAPVDYSLVVSGTIN